MTTALTVAVAESDRVLALPGAGVSVLTDAERRRLAAARTERARADFLAAHLLARLCVARHTGGAARDVVLEQRCPLCSGPHGRPRVAGARCGVSLSYADGGGGGLGRRSPRRHRHRAAARSRRREGCARARPARLRLLPDPRRDRPDPRIPPRPARRSCACGYGRRPWSS
ncbi:hypothetical protein LT493_05460 [Streptomyces tricolor]|nr:hypothetical protein [Streptomyces tricolor]